MPADRSWPGVPWVGTIAEAREFLDSIGDWSDDQRIMVMPWRVDAEEVGRLAVEAEAKWHATGEDT